MARRTLSAPALNQLPYAKPRVSDDMWVHTRRAEQPACGHATGPLPALPSQLETLWVAPSAPANSRASLDRLQQGEPFEPDVAKALTDITGIHLTREGLRNVYRKVAPHLLWDIEAAQLWEGGVMFVVRADTHAGDPAFYCVKVLTAHEDLALELHAFGLYVQPEFRGQALTSRCEATEERFLQTLSNHPKTRLTLAAGGAFNPFMPNAPVESSGFYVHAMHHYLFADEEGPVQHPVSYPPRFPGDDRSMQDRALLIWEFLHWTDRLYQDGSLLDARGKPLGQAAFDALRERIGMCQTPHDFATLDWHGVRVAGRPRQNLGKVYLTSGAAPWWSGVRYVNAQTPARSPAEQHVHERSRWGFQARLLKEMATAQRLSRRPAA